MIENARLANLNDLKEFEGLFTAARRETTTKKGSELWLKFDAVQGSAEKIFDEFISTKSKALIIGEFDSCPLGYMLLELLMIEDAEASNIQEVFVLKEARAVGVGESMMKFAIDWSRSKGASLVLGRTLPGDRETKNFFEKHRLTARLIEVSKQL